MHLYICRLQDKELFDGSRAHLSGRERKDSGKRRVLDVVSVNDWVSGLWKDL